MDGIIYPKQTIKHGVIMDQWEIEGKIVAKALKDPAFRKKLVSQPKEAVREFLKNEKITDFNNFESFTVRVVPTKKLEWVVALPLLDQDGTPLTDQELGKIAAAGVHELPPMH